MGHIYKYIINKKTPLLFLSIFIAILGIQIFLNLPRGLFPEVNYPRIVVDVNMGFTPLSMMEWGVTTVLEKELRSVPGVRLVKSSTSRGLSNIQIFLRENEDVTVATQRVNAKIAEVRALIPPSAIITIRPITAAAFTAAEYCFTSDTFSEQDLRSYVEYTLKPIVLVQPGVFNVKVLGGAQPEYQVQLDPQKMAYYNLTAAMVNNRVLTSNVVDFIGPVDHDGQEVLAFGGELVHGGKNLEQMVVSSHLGRSVYLKDVAQVQLRDAWKYKDLALNGTECVALDVFYQEGIDQSITSKAVKAAVSGEIKKEPHIRYRSWDLNDFTDTATNAVLYDLLLGMAIIAFVTFVFLGSVKYSLFALVVMPLAATFTFIAMKGLGLSLNLMTLGGLTAAIGLVVDNTVIILELYHHKKKTEPGIPMSQRLADVLNSVVKPMFFGTLTIALVFTPIGLLSGVSGMFFSPMAHVHGTALMISLVIAVVIIPSLILLFDKDKKETVSMVEESSLGRFYLKTLRWILQKPKKHVMGIYLFFLLGLIALPLAKTGFLPEWDEGDMVIDYRANDPLSLQSTVDHIRPLEKYLKTIPEIDFFIRKTGTSLGSFDKSPYLGEIIVKLKPHREKSVFELRDQISEHVEKIIPNFEFDFFQILPDRLNDLSGAGKPVAIYLSGKDEVHVDNLANRLVEKLSHIEGLESVRVDETPPAPELIFHINETLSRVIDMSPGDIVQEARLALFSLDSSTIQMGAQTVPIRLKLQEADKKSSIEKLPLYTARGGLRHLGDIGEIKTQSNRVESTHIDGTPVKIVTAELGYRDLGNVMKDVKKVLAENAESGIAVQLAGEYESQQKSFDELIIAFLIGLALIFLMSLFFANNVAIALSLVACAIIPPLVGLVGLVVSGVPLDVSSFSGLISVTGIAVANSFMAIYAIEERAEYRTHFLQAVQEGMKHRLRPILMTNLAAMAGFIPIAVGLSQGDEILQPFSIAIIIGLFGAMFTTLYLMPLFYVIFGSQKEAVNGTDLHMRRYVSHK